MIYGRVTEFCESAIFCVIMGLSNNFTVRAQKCRSDGKHNRSSRDNDSEACDNIFQTSDVMSRKLVK